MGAVHYEIFRIEWIHPNIPTVLMDGPDNLKELVRWFVGFQVSVND